MEEWREVEGGGGGAPPPPPSEETGQLKLPGQNRTYINFIRL